MNPKPAQLTEGSKKKTKPAHQISSGNQRDTSPDSLLVGDLQNMPSVWLNETKTTFRYFTYHVLISMLTSSLYSK